MLFEIENPRQIAGEGKRRWFRGDAVDLIIWYDDNESIEGFQLCYNKTTSEKAFTWRSSGSYYHNSIDDGENAQTFKMTPILIADGAVFPNKIAAIFDKESAKIDPEIVSFIRQKILNYQ